MLFYPVYCGNDCIRRKNEINVIIKYALFNETIYRFKSTYNRKYGISIKIIAILTTNTIKKR